MKFVKEQIGNFDQLPLSISGETWNKINIHIYWDIREKILIRVRNNIINQLQEDIK